MSETKSKAVLSETADWFRKAVPEPEPKNFSTQLGVHFEEVREMLHELNPLTPFTADIILRTDYALAALAKHLKDNERVVGIRSKLEYLDSLADQAVTLTGCAHMSRMDLVGALDAVNASNYSKFVDGKPIFDENKKVAKGPDYRKVDLTPFV